MLGVPLATADALAVGELPAPEALVVGSALALGCTLTVGGALAVGRALAVGTELGRPLAVGCEVETGAWLLPAAGALEAGADGLALGCPPSVALAWGEPEACAELEPKPEGVSLDPVPHAQASRTGVTK